MDLGNKFCDISWSENKFENKRCAKILRGLIVLSISNEPECNHA